MAAYSVTRGLTAKDRDKLLNHALIYGTIFTVQLFTIHPLFKVLFYIFQAQLAVADRFLLREKLSDRTGYVTDHASVHLCQSREI